ncbi:MAG: hypothetical protein EVA89_03145 [Sandaracinaceae bacterium]|nr:MAG: hypothetical protein EVA89_03145 [Sandaracinaceae bacterium]
MGRADDWRGTSDTEVSIGEFPSTDRFEIRRRLGSGSYGVVFEGYDRERQSPIALKWLSYVEPETIHRFKHEFRSLAEISHDNLVQLFDLESDGDRWFFTMELVRGVPLPEFFRPDAMPPGADTMRRLAVSDVMPRLRGRGSSSAPPPNTTVPPLDVDPDELRAVFRDLARGVAALHDAGKLHRDLKCQNCLVTPDGRVVLLDFGLVRDLEQVRRAEPDDIAGTPLYMAPEQCAGAPTERSADWYAFGVMLFRALTDSFPFDGRMYEVMAAKQQRAAPRPSERALGIPEDLESLCVSLLARDPRARPDADAILSRLGAAPSRSRVSFPGRTAEVFVGRRRELRALEAARRVVKLGEPRVVFVQGASGIGKSSLVRHFLDRLRTSDPDALVLEGRCFERETLPYKALDSVVDALVGHLLTVPEEECEAMMPADIGNLVRVFPALGRVPCVRDGRPPLSDVPDPQEQRRRAVVTFRELLARVSSRREVIVFIDDLQWGDRDSAHLLAPSMGTQEAPPILWIGACRSDEAAASPFLSAIETDGDAVSVVNVPELDDEEARTLLELRLSGTARDEELLDELAGEAAGSPLLIDLLVRHAREHSPSGVDLGGALEAQMRDLDANARELLRVLAVRGKPILARTAAEVVGVEALDVKALTGLRNARLLRARSAEDGEELELYHDRIRETVARAMDEATERAVHGRLARALRSHPSVEPESLAFHYRGAGELGEAFHYTLEGARRAESALAFERAAELYRVALSLRPQVEQPRESEVELQVALGDALRNAGRGAQAAAAYVAAAALSPRRKALELRRRAAEQYLFSGHLDEGRAVLRTVLEAVGLSFPNSPVRAFAEFLARRAQVKLRGLQFRERDASRIPEEELLRIDVCWSVSIGLAMIDPVRGGVFQARHLLMALDAGDLGRVARAVAVEVPFAATAGASAHARTVELQQTGRALAERAGSPYNLGLLASSSGGAAWLEGRWREALGREQEALQILRERCTGVAWEIASSTIVYLDVLWRMGRWEELFDQYPAILADAASRGDLLLEIYLRVKFRSLSELARGRPDEAVREARDALARWSQPSFQLIHLWELFLRVEAQMVAGRPEAALERLESGWGPLWRSQLLQLQMYDITMRELSARVHLACAVEAGPARRKKLLAKAMKDVRRLEKTGAPWAAGMAALARASAATITRDDREARRWIDRAVSGFAGADMGLHAEVARARRAQLDGHVAGLAASRDAVERAGVVEPARFLDLWAPGRWDR